MRTKFSGILTLLLAFVVQLTFAQEKTVTGTVTDNSGLPLPGVNILIKGTNNGTQTDFDGNYSINASKGAIISYSYVGFVTKEIVIDNNDRINVSLQEDAAELEEVVIVGFGKKSKTTTTTAISTVAADDIEDMVPSTSIDNMLQGKAAGVQVTAQNGRPGQAAFIQIRGTGSVTAQTTPLYIVDGIPLDDDNVNNINPNDIESFSILKDAASSALYGSRAANGVVIITTKSGRSGDARITFRSSIGSATRIQDPYDMMDASQKLEIERQYAALGINNALNLPGASSSPEELARLRSFDTNWEDELLRNSFIQSNSVSVSGGSEKLNFFLSLGYDKNTGIIDRIKGFERISTRLNTSYQAKDWLKLGVNVAVSRNTTDRPRDRNNVQNPFRGMYTYRPYETLYERNDDGSFVYDELGNKVYNYTHTGFPIALALQTEPENNRNLLTLGNISAEMKLSNNFTNTFKTGITNRRFNRTSASIAGGVLQGYVGSAQFPGTQRDNQRITFEYNVSNIFTYTNTFGEAHNFDVSFLSEFYQRTITDLNVASRGFPTPDIRLQEVAAEQTGGTTNKFQNAIFGLGLLANYNYDQKYIVSASIRRDGSTRFGPENKYGYFYSGSVAWNIAKENFLANSNLVDDLKLRVSYGTSGNDNIGDFRYLDLLAFDQTYNGLTTAIPIGAGNPDIKWESQNQLDIGVEFGLWNNRITGAFDYYIKNSSDLLLDRPISATIGDNDNTILSNIGEIENRGFELGINADVIRNENFKWTVGGTISLIDNEVKKLVNGQDIIRGNTILREGEEINSHFLVRYAGVDPQNGQPLFLTKEGEVTTEYNASDAVIIKDKSPAADFEGGFYTDFQYKGFGIRGDFTFKGGNYIRNIQRSVVLDPNNIGDNLSADAFNYWKNPGDQNVLPSPLYANTSNQISTRFLQKGDFVRLRSLTLSYDFSKKALDKSPFSNFRVYAQGQNLLTFTDYEGDPEIGLGSAENLQPGDANFVPGAFSLFSYPQTKSYIIGIEVGF